MKESSVRKMWIADQGDGTYTNPILYTDYSDPDAIRVGDDFFMVASSFSNTPSVPLLHSKDLVNWTGCRLHATIRRSTAAEPGRRLSGTTMVFIMYLFRSRMRES